jgi:hypothetical protein
MTLLDAPKFDEARENRNRAMLYGGGGLLFIVIVTFWLSALELVGTSAGPARNQPLHGVG